MGGKDFGTGAGQARVYTGEQIEGQENLFAENANELAAYKRLQRALTGNLSGIDRPRLVKMRAGLAGANLAEGANEPKY